jgi:phospholipid/cholesterol/gamma-HCH transport system permease protein
LFGRRLIELITEIGVFSIMMGRVIAEMGGLFKSPGLFFKECIRLGINSAPLVMIVGVFTGAVTGWQSHYQLAGYLPFDLIIAGRVSASIAAELGTMRVTEQIDALESMGISSIRYLALPRIAAMTFMMPVLVVQANFVALMGAAFVLTVFLGLTSTQFWGLIPNFFEVYDIFAGLLKSFFFGLSSSMIGCYIGFRTTGGAEGVGDSTILAFVWSCLAILILDFILAMILF